MEDIFTIVQNDGNDGGVSVRCKVCSTVFKGSGMRVNACEIHLVRQSHMGRLCAQNISTNTVADVQGAAIQAAARKVEKTTVANVVGRIQESTITMMIQRGQSQSTIEYVFDAITHMLTSLTEGGAPIPDGAIVRMTAARPGLSADEKKITAVIREAMAASDEFGPSDSAAFESVVAKASVETSASDQTSFVQGRNLMRKFGALVRDQQKNKTVSKAVDTSRRTVRRKILKLGAEAKKGIDGFFKGAFAVSATGDEGQTPMGGQPFLFTMMGTQRGTYDRGTGAFTFGFKWSHEVVLLIDMNQDETGRSCFKVYTEWYDATYGKQHMLDVCLGFTFDGATKMRSDAKSPLGPAIFDPDLPPAVEMLLVKSGVLAGDSLGGRLQRFAAVSRGVSGMAKEGYPTAGFDDQDMLPESEPNRPMLFWMFHGLLHMLNLMMDKVMKYHCRPCAMRSLAALATYARKSSSRNEELRRTAVALSAAQCSIRDAVQNNSALGGASASSESESSGDDSDGGGGAAVAAEPQDNVYAVYLTMSNLNSARWLSAFIVLKQTLRNLATFNHIKDRHIEEGRVPKTVEPPEPDGRPNEGGWVAATDHDSPSALTKTDFDASLAKPRSVFLHADIGIYDDNQGRFAWLYDFHFAYAIAVKYFQTDKEPIQPFVAPALKRMMGKVGSYTDSSAGEVGGPIYVLWKQGLRKTHRAMATRGDAEALMSRLDEEVLEFGRGFQYFFKFHIHPYLPALMALELANPYVSPATLEDPRTWEGLQLICYGFGMEVAQTRLSLAAMRSHFAERKSPIEERSCAANWIGYMDADVVRSPRFYYENQLVMDFVARVSALALVSYKAEQKFSEMDWMCGDRKARTKLTVFENAMYIKSTQRLEADAARDNGGVGAGNFKPSFLGS
jgi:hypothetical protein